MADERATTEEIDQALRDLVDALEKEIEGKPPAEAALFTEEYKWAKAILEGTHPHLMEEAE